MLACWILLCSVTAFADEPVKDEIKEERSRDVQQLLNQGQHLFRMNVGQWEDDIYFRSISAQTSLSFMEDRISFGLRKAPEGYDLLDAKMEADAPNMRSKFLIWNLQFEGAGNMKPVASEVVADKVNYFGPGRTEALQIPAYTRLTYNDLYPLIDLTFYNSKESGLKYDVIVRAGGDLDQVRLNYDGVRSLEVDEQGRLIIETEWGAFREEAPYSYQIIQGKEVPVQVNYRVSGTTLTYKVEGDYDPSYDLIVDPIYVDWSTYFYGTGKSTVYTYAWTYVEDLDMDDEFNVYIGGRTTDHFPAMSGVYDTTIGGYYDAFLCKMNKDGDSLIYFTYLGGSNWEFTSAITVNSLKEPVLAGMTWANDFPITKNAFDTVGASTSNYKSFVTKFSSDGSKLIFSTYLGGSGWFNSIKGMELNDKGDVYLIGATNSHDFPTTSGCLQSSYAGGNGSWTYYHRDVFFTIMKSDGTDLIYSTYIGGAGNETGMNLALNPNGEIYLVGHTNSSNFPVTSGSRQFFNVVAQGPEDGFIMKLSKDGKSIIYSHLMGGGGTDVFEGIYVNKYDEPYIAGYSNSSNFPVKNAYQSSNRGGYDQIIVKMISSGTNVRYSTYLGGSSDDYFYNGWWYYSFPNIRIAANIREEAIICGLSKSVDYPTTPDALQRINKSSQGVSTWWKTSSTIAKLNYTGDKLLYGSYWGGSGYEYPGAVSLKRVSCYTSILYGGMTTSNDYPTTEGVYRDSSFDRGTNWSWNGFVSRFRDTLYTDEIELALQDTIVECDKVYVILDAQNQGADIKWSHGPKDRWVILQDTGTYWVSATYGCDTVRDTISVRLEHIPKVPVLGADSIYCDKYIPVWLDAKHDTIRRSLKWNTGDTSQKIYADKPGKYWVDIITPNCGTKTDTITFTLKQSPDINLRGDTTTCDSVSLVLDAGYINNEMAYRWSTGDSVQSITVRDTGIYSVKMSSYCGVDSASVHIKMRNTPVVDLPPDSIFCDQVNFTLYVGTPDNGEEYIWTDWDRSVAYGTADSLKRFFPGDLRVQIENICGLVEDSMRISMLNTPVYGVVDTVYECDNVDELLEVQPRDAFLDYRWQNGSVAPDFRAQGPGNYKVLISNKCGVDSLQWLVVLKQTPTVRLPNDSSYCGNVNVNLNAEITDNEAQYIWQDGSTQPAYSVKQAGKYRVEIRNRCGVARDSVSYTVINTPFLDLDPEYVYCGSVQPLTLNVGTPNNEEVYVWSSGAVSNEEQFSSAGKHWVRISNKCATRSDTFNIRVSAYPIVDLGPDTILCGNFNLKLDAGNPGATYLWEPYGQQTQTIDAREQIIYTVRVTNADGCSSSDVFEIGSGCISTYYVPNAISPNNDQLNDVFVPELVNYESYELQIFNRWGELLYQSNEATEGWNGHYKGERVPQGVYFYKMRFITTENGAYVDLSGPIHVIY
ncbi:MAG: gliding motility-associated C-terminal domain-containing protein [Flavobacteriales bacterium]|nr:gliding motility-associated C-terminal domain-containing protein [Flavobacteriales bacterium]